MLTTLVRLSCLSLLTLAVGLTAPMMPAHGQNASNQSTSDQARAAWQPIRDLSRGSGPKLRPMPRTVPAVPISAVSKDERETRPTSRVRRNETGSRRSGTRIRRTSASTPSIPPSGETIMSQSVPLDGQVVVEPMEGTIIHDPAMSQPMLHDPMLHGPILHDPSLHGDHHHGTLHHSELGCDGLPGAECGCDGLACHGGQICSGNPMCGQYDDCDTLQPCVTLCWPQDGWFSAEYLLWYADGMDTPPLASTGPLPGGQVLFGGSELLDDQFDGLRLEFGFWLDNCHTWGIGADYFRLNTATDSFFGTPTGNPLLGRPFQNLNQGGAEQIEEVNSNRVTGTLAINVDSELYGWGVHLRHLRGASQGCVTDLHCQPQAFCSRTEYLVGFRQVSLNEGIGIQESLTALDNPLIFDVRDRFRTRNQFNGIDLGILYSRVRGYWNFDAGIRLGIGNTRQRVSIDGSTVIDFTGTGTAPAGDGQRQVGGLLAQPSNIGEYSRDVFSVLPQLDLKLGYQLTDQLRATVGYTFLYWSNVVRPGDQIDRLVDVSQLPQLPINTTPAPAAFPEFDFDNTDYWAQGLSFGAEYRW